MPQDTIKSKGDFSFRNRGDDGKRSKRLKALIILAIAMVISLQLSTQYIAEKLQYHQVLGNYLFMVGGTPVYLFYKCIGWMIQLSKFPDAEEIIQTAILFPALGFLVSALLVKVTTKQKDKRIEALHGSAQWAQKKDIIEAGLLTRDGKELSEGVYVGGWYDPTTKKVLRLRENSKMHTLVFAPTRSGKGVGLVIPTLLGWAESAFILDIKGENWALTAGWRQKEMQWKKTEVLADGTKREITKTGSEVYKFDPTDPTAYTEGTSVTFNPLEEIILDYPDPRPATERDIEDNYDLRQQCEHRGSAETATVQNIVSILTDPGTSATSGNDDFFRTTSSSLLAGCIIHLLYKGQREGFTPCLADVIHEFTAPDKALDETLTSWKNYPHYGYCDGEPIVHPFVASAAQEMLTRWEKSDKEASAVLSSAIAYLTLYRDPIIAQNTRLSSFKIKDLMFREKPVSLYFVIKPVDKDRIKPFIRLFLTQMIRVLADDMHFEGGRSVDHYDHRLLLMLDEFPTLGNLPVFEEAIAFVGGYGLKCYLITQDTTQLQKAYSRNESIMSNCNVKVAYAPNKLETAEMLSKMVGTTTVIKQNISESISSGASPFKGGGRSKSISYQEVSRPLFLPDEVMRLPGPSRDSKGDITEAGDMLVLPTGFAPVYGRQLLYFQDAEFNRRSKIEVERTDHAIDIVARREAEDKARNFLIHQREAENEEFKRKMQEELEMSVELDEEDMEFLGDLREAQEGNAS